MLKSTGPRKNVRRTAFHDRGVRRNKSTREAIMFPISLALTVTITRKGKREPNVKTVERRQTRDGRAVRVRFFDSNRALTTMFLPIMIELEHSLNGCSAPLVGRGLMRHDLQPGGVDAAKCVTRRKAERLVIVRNITICVTGLAKFMVLSRVASSIQDHLTDVVPSLRDNSRRQA